MKTWRRAVLLLLVAAAARLASADPLAVRITGVGPNRLDLSWSQPAADCAYGAQACTCLKTGDWRWAGDTDAWPTDMTNWSVSASATAGFWRVRGCRRGRLLSSQMQRHFSRAEVNGLLQLYGAPPVASNAVTVYQIVHETFDPRDLAAVGSGALMVPDVAGRVPLLACQHGTLFLKSDAPSIAGSASQGMGIVFASTGYAVAMPDLLGLGTNSPGLHPYLHARSEATAGVDLLRACRTFIDSDLTLRLNGQLFLAGYSQGGHATLALQRELEQRHAAEFPITASAPMAGPYDLSGVTARHLVSPQPYSSPSYVAYVVFGLNGVYRLFEDAGSVFAAPYDTALPPLFDGMHGSGTIDAAMPSIPREAFRPDYLADFTNNPAGPLRAALRANDLWDWTPRAPTRLYHCSGDTVVPFTNSQVALTHFIANGATNVSLVDPFPGADHGSCALPSLVAAKAWFDSLKTP